MAILQCENITYLYSVGTPFETAAVKDISFLCEKGEIIGVIGHTGSGKSTLIQHLNGLLEPSSGKVYLNGNDIWSKENRKNIRRVRFAVGLCFQYPEYQIFEETVFKEIAFGPSQMGLDEAEIVIGRRYAFVARHIHPVGNDLIGIFRDRDLFFLGTGGQRQCEKQDDKQFLHQIPLTSILSNSSSIFSLEPRSLDMQVARDAALAYLKDSSTLAPRMTPYR